MRTMNGGYAMINLASETIYADVVAALASNKPIVVYEATRAPYYADSVTTSGTNVVITKGGKTITIANDNTITNVGDIQPIEPVQSDWLQDDNTKLDYIKNKPTFKKLYAHFIRLQGAVPENNVCCTLVLYNDTNSKYDTIAKLKTYLSSLALDGFMGDDGKYHTATGDSPNGVIMGVSSGGPNNLMYVTLTSGSVTYNEFNAGSTIIDIVKEIL